MTNNDDLTAIRTRFLSVWDSSVQCVLDNEPPIAEPTAQIWTRLSVVPGVERRKSIASKTYEQLGRTYFQIFVPDGFSTFEGWALSEAFAAIFRDWKSSDYRIRFDTPEFRSSSSEKGYLTITVSIPYTAQH